MTFEELQEKANRRFGRRLSDREIAEVAIENLNEAEAKADSFETAIEGYREEVRQLRGELSECGRLSTLARAVSTRIEEILSVTANEYEIKINVSHDCIPTIDFTIKGNPIRYEEEDYE